MYVESCSQELLQLIGERYQEIRQRIILKLHHIYSFQKTSFKNILVARMEGIFPLKLPALKHLAGSVDGEYNIWSWGFKFKPHVGCSDNLKVKSVKNF